MKKVFFDTSVILSAIHSDKGFSFKLVSLVKKSKIVGVISETIIEEAERNLTKILKNKKADIKNYIAENNLLVLEQIKEEDIEPYLKSVEQKDAHVLFAAIFAKCHFLATLDKKHIDNEQIKKHFSSQIKIGSPHEVYDQILLL
jgi:putative PIN family toxin of toxin-antitoxin system